MKDTKILNYKVSGDPMLLAEINHITSHVSDILREIHEDVVKGKKKMIPKLIKLSLKYPKVPQFKNNLSTVYQKQGDIQKAYETNKWVVAEHPNYLFGKLNLANEYIFKGEFEKVPQVLGELLEISALYPKRDEFHVNEVMSFNFTAIQYFLGIMDIEQAEIWLDIMKDLDEDSPNVVDAIRMIASHAFRSAPERFAKQLEESKQVFVPNRKGAIQTMKEPEFHFPKQMNYLYTNSTDIDAELLKEILALDLEKLLEDLLTIIKDSIVRFEHYSNQVEIDGWDDNRYSFLTHALLLLSEIKDPKSLEKVLDIARQDEEYLDFWFGDISRESYGYIIYELAKKELPTILNFLKEPNLYCYIKSVVVESVFGISDSRPDKYDEVIVFSNELLSFHIENKDNEDIVDTEFLGLFVSDLVDLGAKELILKIKQLFDNNIVGYWVCGDYESVKKDIFKDPIDNSFSFDCTLAQKYKRLNEFGNFNFEDIVKEEPISTSNSTFPFMPSNKTGRNEPCPCGSGKKYKKCCIKI